MLGYRLDFRRLPLPVFDPPRREALLGGMSAGSFSRTAASNRAQSLLFRMPSPGLRLFILVEIFSLRARGRPHSTKRSWIRKSLIPENQAALSINIVPLFFNFVFHRKNPLFVSTLPVFESFYLHVPGLV